MCHRGVAWGIGAVSLALIVLGFGLEPWRAAAQGLWSGPDSYYVLDVLSAHGPLGFVPRDAAPDGVWSHWSMPYLWAIQSTAWLARHLGWSALEALGVGGAVWGLGSLLGLWALLGWSRRPGSGTWVLGGLLLATSVPIEVYARPDRITHHLFLLLPVAIAWGALWRPRGGAWAGILLAVAVWASPESAPLLLGGVGLRLALRTTRGRRFPCWSMALGLIGTLLLAWILDPPPPTFGPWALDHMSLAYVVLGGLVSLPLLGVGLLDRTGPWPWMLAETGLGAAVLSWVAWVPGAKGGPSGLVPQDIRWMWWDRVVELQPLDTPLLLGLGLLMPGIVLLLALWHGRRDLVGLTWCGVLACLCVMAGLHERSTIPLAWMAAVVLASLPLHRFVQVGIAMLACVAWLWLSSPLRPQGPDDPCPVGPIAASLDSLGDATVLAPLDLAPELLWRVPGIHVVAGPYHHNVEGMRDVLHAWGAVASSGDTAARSVVARRHVGYLLVCPIATPTLYGPRSLAVRLGLGQAPPWLARMDLPEYTPWKLFRVLDPAR